MKERRDEVIRFRVTKAERKRVEALSKRTGQSYSDLFRIQTLRLDVSLDELVKIVKVEADHEEGQSKVVHKRESRTG